MTLDEFGQAMALILGAFGDRRFPPVLLRHIFNEVEILDARLFERHLKNVLYNATHVPSPGLILKTCEVDIQKRRAELKQGRIDKLAAGRQPCLRCANWGWLYALDDGGHEFGFRCPHCPFAEARGIHHDIPLWCDAVHGEKFRIRPIGALNTSPDRGTKREFQDAMRAMGVTEGFKTDAELAAERKRDWHADLD